MIIEYRNPALTYTKGIKEEKIRLVLSWLLEFRFSSFDLLAARLGVNTHYANRFFNVLIKDDLLCVFKNVHTNHQRYVILGPNGVSYLQAIGQDVTNAHTRPKNLGKYVQILHDLSVQNVVLEYGVNNPDRSFDQVVWERHATFEQSKVDEIQGFVFPDALIHSKSNFWAAIEFERWRKDRKRIFHNFVHHTQAIRQGLYSGVLYFFQEKIDEKHYRNLFDEPEWPLFVRDHKTALIRATGHSINKNDLQQGIEKHFQFACLPFTL